MVCLIVYVHDLQAGRSIWIPHSFCRFHTELGPNDIVGYPVFKPSPTPGNAPPFTFEKEAIVPIELLCQVSNGTAELTARRVRIANLFLRLGISVYGLAWDPKAARMLSQEVFETYRHAEQ